MIKNKKTIEALLKEGIDASKIYYYEETTSTNTLAKEKARASADAGGSIFIAERQTAGRGKPGRQFFSPDGGIYISFVFTPENMSAGRALDFTLAAAVAACEAIENVTGRQPRIKWVNDILLDGKKIGGILTESEIEADSGCFKWVVVGIGINYCIRREDFPEELKAKAGSLYPDGQAGVSKACMVAELINRVTDIMPGKCLSGEVPKSGSVGNGDSPSKKTSVQTMDHPLYAGTEYADTILYRYKERLDTLGKKVDVQLAGESFPATAVDLDENGGLVIKKDDGTIKVLSSGEVWQQPSS